MGDPKERRGERGGMRELEKEGKMGERLERRIEGGGKGRRDGRRKGERRNVGDGGGAIQLRPQGLTLSQQSTSAAMTIECVFMRVLTTVQNAL